MGSKARTTGTRRGDISLLALCALLALAPHLGAAQARSAPATQQVVLWWLQSTLDSAPPPGSPAATLPETAALLASLGESAPAAVTHPNLLPAERVEYSKPGPTIRQSHISAVALVATPIIRSFTLNQPALEPHLAALLSGMRTNIVLE